MEVRIFIFLRENVTCIWSALEKEKVSCVRISQAPVTH
jgi:hypothetical protein